MPGNGSPPADAQVADLRTSLAVLRRRRWSIVLVTALVLGTALGVSALQTPEYTATARVLVKPINPNQLVQGVPAASVIDMETERGLVESPRVAELAAEQLGPAVSARDLRDHVSASVPANTQFLDVAFTATDPGRAQRSAQALADAYIAFRRTEALDAYATAAQGYQRQIDDLQSEQADAQAQLEAAPSGSDEAAALQARIQSIDGRIAVLQAQIAPLLAPSVDPGDVVAPAERPTSPSSPDLVRNGLLALVVGLALGIGLAFLRERLDDRLQGREDLEEQLDAPVLAVVPKIPGWRGGEQVRLPALHEPKSAAAEAYRTLRTSLQFLAEQDGLRVIMVTSPALGEGKTTTVANLAVVLAQAGRRVVVIGCDLHKPRLYRFFGIPNDGGLTEILAGTVDVASASKKVGPETLRVIPGGRIPANPAELLASETMGRLLEQLRQHADLVLLDTPPVLAVSDALGLVPLTDGAIVVADAGTTTRAVVRFVREQLEQVGGRIVGGVLNNLDPARARAYPSYYRQYYSSGYSQGPRDRGNGNGSRRAREVSETWKPEDMWR